jgi:hypothetical protein
VCFVAKGTTRRFRTDDIVRFDPNFILSSVCSDSLLRSSCVLDILGKPVHSGVPLFHELSTGNKLAEVAVSDIDLLRLRSKKQSTSTTVMSYPQ